ncbi:hypothetical protein ACVR0B_09050, partial [Streptococcus didelphis]
MYRKQEFAYFVYRRNNLEKMIDLLVSMIPDREFYYPEINQGELSGAGQKLVLIAKKDEHFLTELLVFCSKILYNCNNDKTTEGVFR